MQAMFPNDSEEGQKYLPAALGFVRPKSSIYVFGARQYVSFRLYQSNHLKHHAVQY